VLAIGLAGWLSLRLAVQGYLMLISTVNGFTVDQTGVEDERALDSAAATVQETAHMTRGYIASPPPRLFPNMTALADEFPFADE
jgi:hypothetical protein